MSSRPVAAGAAMVVLMIAGCGGDDGRSAVNNPFDPQINLADCNSWKSESVEERLATVDQIQRFTGGSVQGTGGQGATLTNDQAFDLFETTCANDYASYFKLYKLYGRAAAFAGS